ncbi:MAG: hypothetical protein KGQ36_05330 [Rickettsiales bacterium]|nr:hypothetical protein [Rickettsiales bacterium]
MRNNSNFKNNGPFRTRLTVIDKDSDEELKSGYETPDDGGGKMSAQVTPNSASSLGSIGFDELGIDGYDSEHSIDLKTNSSEEHDRSGASNAKFLDERRRKMVVNRAAVLAYGAVPPFPGATEEIKKRVAGNDDGSDNNSNKKIKYTAKDPNNNKMDYDGYEFPDSSTEKPFTKKMRGNEDKSK